MQWKEEPLKKELGFLNLLNLLEYNDSLSCLCSGEGVCKREVGACVLCEVLGVGPSLIMPPIMSEPVRTFECQ